MEIDWADGGDLEDPMRLLEKTEVCHPGCHLHGAHTPNAAGLTVVESMSAEGRPLGRQKFHGETTYVSQRWHVEESPSLPTLFAPENQLSAGRERPDAALVWNESTGEIGR